MRGLEKQVKDQSIKYSIVMSLDHRLSFIEKGTLVIQNRTNYSINRENCLIMRPLTEQMNTFPTPGDARAGRAPGPRAASARLLHQPLHPDRPAHPPRRPPARQDHQHQHALLVRLPEQLLRAQHRDVKGVHSRPIDRSIRCHFDQSILCLFEHSFPGWVLD